jgi:hypothetical protein
MTDPTPTPRPNQTQNPTTPRRPRAPRTPAFAAGLVFTLALAGVLPGCTATRSDADAGNPAYPLDRPVVSTVDIQVVRRETEITLTNTTARAFPATRMWVNQWYGRDIPALGVGQTLTLDLSTFTDEYDQPFRAGGFWATRRPEKLVKAELETPEGLVGLVVVGRED